MRELFITDAPAATVLVRIMTGSVFLSEGIQKFLYPEDLAAGRLAKIGIPSPETTGPFVDGCEVVCGALLIVGLLTRLFSYSVFILSILRSSLRTRCRSVTFSRSSLRIFCSVEIRFGMARFNHKAP
jgi:putative oxidoreductase